MSGIAGLLRLDDRPADADELAGMLARLAHRGPDGSGSWLGKSVGLGHQMLRATPESINERMPLSDARREIVLTADVRLDNRDELIGELGLKPEGANAIPDSRIVLAAYGLWGENCPERLLGDFAFAIWDARRETLFCARDHIGCKPFYYCHRPGECFAFASEIKSLLCLDPSLARVNEPRIGDLLAGILDGSEITFYRNVLRLPPAHRMTIGRSGLQMRKYWSLDPDREVRWDSDRAYAAAFRQVFTEAVRCRMRRVGPPAASLSGGLDSSSIVCMAGHLISAGAGEPLHTFSEVWKGYPDGDELPFVNAVAEKARAVSHPIDGDDIGPLAHLEEMYAHLEQPSDNIYTSVGWERRRRIADLGARVVLDGTGGDVSVSYDFSYLADLARSGRWLTLWREASGLASHYLKNPRKRYGLVGRFAVLPFIPAPLRSAWQRLRSRSKGAVLAGIGIPLNRRFIKDIGLEERLRTLQRRDSASMSTRQRHILGFDEMIPYSMELMDKSNAAFGFERRCPFLDKRLVEFCVAMPWEQRICGGMTRVIVRRALQDLLPEILIRRGTKGDASRNVARALLTHDRERVERLLFAHEHACARYVDIPAIREVFRRLLARRMVKDAHAVWSVLDLELWLRRSGLGT